MLSILRRSSPPAALARRLYDALTAQARRPAFFRELGVADTIDGRFDMVALHAWLVFGRLKAAGMQDVARKLSDTVFTGFDEALRELGTGDMGLGPRMKKLGLAFNGRLHAYEAADGEAAMAQAIIRNVYRGMEGKERDAAILAHYAFAAREHLKLSDPASGTLDFGPLRTMSA